VYTATHLSARLIEAGRVEEARAATGRALRLLRQQADAPTAAASRFTEYAWLLLVAQPADLRDPATALTYARRALDLPRGTNPDALAVFALAQHQTGDAAGAVATARRIYDMVPELRADRDDAALLRDIRGNFTRHPLTPLARPVWF
jgi:tetratricopeptide (TPR) repeat protein